MILPLTSDRASLEVAGGKGMNLARLVRAGFNVPDGFIVTTDAYRAFVADNELQAAISAHIAHLDASDMGGLQAASSAIRQAFALGTVPKSLAGQLRQAYAALGETDGPVAVRSSATAEDMFDLSFAGQQDTFLNIIGYEALTQAVVGCWSSLWTARAIGYRIRNRFEGSDIALAVIVQKMISSDVSGVLFTANPLNGKRTEMALDATWGLGEALVSGQVEPDHYVVRSADGRILHKTIGSKALVIRGRDEGGTITETTDISSQQALPDRVIAELAGLGRATEDLFMFPQDVEWAWESGQLWLLQSRPITSLFPLLGGVAASTEPVKATFSFGAVQGMLEPITPLGRDTIRAIFAGAGRLFDYHVTAQTQAVVYTAGERLFVNVSPLVRHPIGRRLLPRLISFVEPGAAGIFTLLLKDERFRRAKRGLKLDTVRRVGKFVLPVIPRYWRALRHPDRERKRFQQGTNDLSSGFNQRLIAETTLAARIQLCEDEIMGLFPYLLPRFIPLMGVGMASLTILNRFASNAARDNALAVTRGLPHNVTTQMDLALWQTAVAIKGDAESAARFSAASSAILAQQYLARELPPVAQEAVAIFLERYGVRGVGEIDLGRPRWREDPTQLMQTLRGYLQIADPLMAPDTVFHRSQQEARESIVQLQEEVRHGMFGRLRARFVRIAARRVRTLSGLRETPKFTIIRIMDAIRNSLLESGQQLVEEGLLQQADDLFYLRFNEIKRLAQGQKADWKETIRGRRLALETEKNRRQIPLVLLSDGQAFYGGPLTGDEQSERVLLGTPVSPGVVEGRVRVVLEPHTAQLQPGEILVCPGTDPAWTPLFLSAGGLIMEVGGLMTHGSVVAREYGIPAVVGVFQATTRLHDGQAVGVDGNNGKIFLLE